MVKFTDYCKHGNIDDIKKMSLKDCNLEKGFRFACMNGHYDIVRYLVELYKNDKNYKPIDIHSCDEAGFILACMNGHYDIVRYLVELHKNDDKYKYIDIHSYDEQGFRWACTYGDYEIVKYLLKITKKYKPFNNYLIAFKKIDKYKL
jgi:ankyrin repeat protein